MLSTGAHCDDFYFATNDPFHIFHFWKAKKELNKLSNFSEKIIKRLAIFPSLYKADL